MGRQAHSFPGEKLTITPGLSLIIKFQEQSLIRLGYSPPTKLMGESLSLEVHEQLRCRPDCAVWSAPLFTY